MILLIFLALLILIGMSVSVVINEKMTADKKGNAMGTQNTLVTEGKNEPNQELIDFRGYVDKIENDMIYITSTRYGYIGVKNASKIVNCLTSEEMELSGIKSGDYLSIKNCYRHEGDVIVSKSDIWIYRNISGEEMKQEILKNFIKRCDGVGGSPTIKEIHYINSNKEALVTFEVGYPFEHLFIGKASEHYEFQFIINERTAIYSNNGLVNNIDTLEEAKYLLLVIILDENTINDKYPVVTFFSAYDD